MIVLDRRNSCKVSRTFFVCSYSMIDEKTVNIIGVLSPGGYGVATGGPLAWGLCFNREMSPSQSYCDDSYKYTYPCAPGAEYYGRGALPIYWSVNFLYFRTKQKKPNLLFFFSLLLMFFVISFVFRLKRSVFTQFFAVYKRFLSRDVAMKSYPILLHDDIVLVSYISVMNCHE